MTNREYIIDALAGEFGDGAYEDAVSRFSCPYRDRACPDTIIDCLCCVKEWLKEEMSE